MQLVTFSIDYGGYLDFQIVLIYPEKWFPSPEWWFPIAGQQGHGSRNTQYRPIYERQAKCVLDTDNETIISRSTTISGLFSSKEIQYNNPRVLI